MGKYLFIAISLLTALCLSDGIFAQKKNEKNVKKKLYISTIKAKGVNLQFAERIKNGIRLGIFENLDARYQVFDDDAVNVMYKQAEVIIESECNDESCMTQIADSINADEIVYGEVSLKGVKIEINITCLERKDLAHVTKSIVNISFFESQLDYASLEAAKKILNPQYRIDMSKAPDGNNGIKLENKEIKTIKGLDVSVIRFKTKEELARKIIDASSEIVSEGDRYFDQQSWNKARDRYLDVIKRVNTDLPIDSQTAVKGYIDGMYNRVESTYLMEYKLEIEKVDELLKAIKSPNDGDFEKAIGMYKSIMDDVNKIPKEYSDVHEKLKTALNDRIDDLNVAIHLFYEKNGDALYHDYKFPEAMEWYLKAENRIGIVINHEKKISSLDQVSEKIIIAQKTGSGYLLSRIKSLADVAVFYNSKGDTGNARGALKDAHKLITGPMRIFITPVVIETYNEIADVLRVGGISRESEPNLYADLDKRKAKENTIAEEKELIEREKIAKAEREAQLVELKKKGVLAKEIGSIMFMKIPGGSFVMGLPEGIGGNNEHPRHRVIIDSFYIGIYEVTQKQFEDVMGVNPSFFKGDNLLPVENVSHDEAMEFCKEFSKKYNVKARLPYEAEWEYACRAGTTTKYYWGDNIKGDYCWFGDNSYGKTHPVGQKLPNAWGLYDMSGNVWEWCIDWYGADYYKNSPERNPQGPGIGGIRILRGGSWDDYDIGNLHSADRDWLYPGNRCNSVGFRVVLSLP